MLKIVEKVAVVVVLMVAMAGGAVAQTAPAAQAPLPAKATAVDPARIKAARTLIERIGAAREFDSVMPLVLAQLQQALERRAPQNRKDVTEVMQALAGKYAPRNSELLDEVAAHYAKILSIEDINAVSEFFASPAGTRYVAAAADLMKGSIAVGQEWGRKIAEEIRKEAEEELKKRGVKL